MRRGRRERELRALLRVPEQGCYNLAAFIAAHGAELGLDGAAYNEPDEGLVPRLRAHLERWQQEQRQLADADVLSTAHELVAGARWRNGGVVLHVGPLFRLASPTIGKQYVRFVGDSLDIAVSRERLQRAGAALRPFRDIRASVDDGGLHLRWDGRGGLNFKPQTLRQPTDAFVLALPPRAAPRGVPILIGEILAELGYGT